MNENLPRHGWILITGASTGIGKACALTLAQRGYGVFAGVRRLEDGDELVAPSSGTIVPVILDVTIQKNIDDAARKIEEIVGDGHLVGLVNNAGVAIGGPLEVLPLDQFRHQLEVNTTGQLAVTQAILPLLRKSRGRTIFISSDNGKGVWPYLGAYSASKFAIEAVADALRMELVPWKMKVSIVEPGSIKTPIWRKSKTTGDEIVEKMPSSAIELYGPMIQKLLKVADSMEKKGIPAEKVADVVLHAMTSPSPKTRYTVGMDCKIHLFLTKWLPASLRDRLILKLIDHFGK